MPSISSQALRSKPALESGRASKPVSRSYASDVQHRRLLVGCKDAGQQLKHIISENAAKKEFRKVTGPHGCIRSIASRSNHEKIFPAIMPINELARLKKASKVVSLSETMQEMEKIEANKKRTERECEYRKKQMRNIDDARETVQSGEVQGESSQKEDKVKVLDRAYLLKQEQEEEIKQANRIILAAKCHIIRDAQIQEKHELARELKEEDLRLEQQMDKERSKAVSGADDKLKVAKEQNCKHAILVKRQLEQREIQRLIQAEEIELEAKILAQAKTAVERDAEVEARLKHEKTTKLRSDLQKVSELNALFKKMEFDQQREAEMKVLNYMREKEEREKKLAIEKKVTKETLERKQERMISQQQKVLESKQELTEMTIRREQEIKEREFRRKEKEAAMKRKKTENELAESRMAQLSELKLRKSLQLERDEADFKRICQKLKEEEAKEQKKEELRLRNKEKYREEIAKQVREKERERLEIQRRAKNEYCAWQEKEKLREQSIRTVIKGKIDAMRNANMPEKFIKDVEKQLNVSGN